MLFDMFKAFDEIDNSTNWFFSLQKTYFLSCLCNHFWATILYKYHGHTLVLIYKRLRIKVSLDKAFRQQNPRPQYIMSKNICQTTNLTPLPLALVSNLESKDDLALAHYLENPYSTDMYCTYINWQVKKILIISITLISFVFLVSRFHGDTRLGYSSLRHYSWYRTSAKKLQLPFYLDGNSEHGALKENR